LSITKTILLINKLEKRIKKEIKEFTYDQWNYTFNKNIEGVYFTFDIFFIYDTDQYEITICTRENNIWEDIIYSKNDDSFNRNFVKTILKLIAWRKE
jgi:hypothetical protein